MKRVQEEHDAEDILQDVFAKIHTNLSSLKGEEKVTAWVYQIARNSIIDYYRHRSRVGTQNSEFPEDIPQYVPEEDTLEEITSCLRPMIDELPEKYHEMIDARQCGTGERMVFEPYTRETFDRTHRWMKEWGMFPEEQVGQADYDKVVAL